MKRRKAECGGLLKMLKRCIGLLFGPIERGKYRWR